MDFDLDGLPVIAIDHHPEGFDTIDSEPDNDQTRKIFAGEAARVVAATPKLRWVAPSRDEDPHGPLELAAEPQIVVAGQDTPEPEMLITVQGGRERGLVIHKLLEEVLTGETADDLVALGTRGGSGPGAWRRARHRRGRWPLTGRDGRHGRAHAGNAGYRCVASASDRRASGIWHQRRRCRRTRNLRCS